MSGKHAPYPEETLAYYTNLVSDHPGMHLKHLKEILSKRDDVPTGNPQTVLKRLVRNGVLESYWTPLTNTLKRTALREVYFTKEKFNLVETENLATVISVFAKRD